MRQQLQRLLGRQRAPVLGTAVMGAWLPWTAPPAATEALCRLRIATGAPSLRFQVELRRGEARKVVEADAEGRVSLTREQLAGLTTGPTLTLSVSSPATPVTGTVRFTDLRVSVLNS